MIYQHLYKKYKKKDFVNLGVIGAGNYGTEIIAQSFKHPLVKTQIVADYDIEAAREAYNVSGISDDQIVQCDSRASALCAIEAGKYVITEDAMILTELPLDVIAEATGIPEAGARHAYGAIKNGIHVAMVNKETDSVVGPILKHLADKAGVVYTAVDGDQHGLLMGLVNWAESCGFKILCGGKFSDGEAVYNRENRIATLNHSDIKVNIPEKDAWAFDLIPEGKIDLYLKKRSEILCNLTKAGGWDMCELTNATNATGLLPETPLLHQPFLRIPEIPSVLCSVEDGGILTNSGVMDIVTVLREDDEVTGGGGVFIVIANSKDFIGSHMHGNPISNSNGSTTLIIRPYHLTGMETLTTILCAGLLDIPTGGGTILPRYDIVRKSAVDLKAGQVLGGDHDEVMETLMVPAKALSKDEPFPAHMINGNKLIKDIPAGTFITADMIDAPKDSVLWSLRKQQDEHFLTKMEGN